MKLVLYLAFLATLPAIAAIEQKVLICGVCKDVAERVPYSLKIIEKIGAMFNDYRVIVYENNSSDETPQILKKWATSNGKALLISEQVSPAVLDQSIVNRLDNGDYFRPEAIARARNIVLHKAMSDEYEGFNYVIWIDLDFKLEPNYEGIKEVFESKKQWDAVFAFGVDPRGEHWDWYALRDEVCPFGPELLGHVWFGPKQLRLDKAGEWYPVYSAFGGFGIYKKSSIKDCFYSALVTKDLGLLANQIINAQSNHPIIKQYLHGKDHLSSCVSIALGVRAMKDIVSPDIGIVINDCPSNIVWRMNSFVYKYPVVCEHVPFHASMIIRGHDKLFINPRLVFHYGDFIKD